MPLTAQHRVVGRGGYLGEEVVVPRAAGEAGEEEGKDVGTAAAEQLSQLFTTSVAKMEGTITNLRGERGRGLTLS